MSGISSLIMPTSRAAYITTSWDDGHPLDMRLSELLRKYELPATFYVPLCHEAPLLTPTQIRELSSDFEIGGHTVHHCDLTRIPMMSARWEIAACKDRLEQITGQPCNAFSFPFGRFHRYHMPTAAGAGFRVARTVELMSLSMPRRCDGIALMPTTLQAFPMAPARLLRNAVRRLSLGNLLRCVACYRSDWVAAAEVMLERVVQQGGVFHLWGHSWELESMDQWHNLERLFHRLSKVQAHFVTNGKLGELCLLEQN